MVSKGTRYGTGIVEHPPGSGKLWARVKYLGKQYWKRAANRTHARALVHQMHTAILKGEFPPKPTERPSLFNELLEDYKLAKQRAAKAIMRTDIGYRRLIERFGGRRADSITLAEVEEWQRDLMGSMSIASANHHLQLLRAILLRGVTNRRLRREDVPPMKLENPNNKRVRYLTDNEELLLMAVSPVWFQPLVSLAIHTGMRKGEMLCLTWPDVDFTTGTIWIRDAKSGEGRRLPMNSVARAALITMREARRERLRARVVSRNEAAAFVVAAPEGGFFHNLNRYWYVALKRAGITNLHFHDLRHTFATRYMMAGGNLFSLQTLLGHKTAAMVQRYAHLDEKHLQAEVERLVVRKAKSGEQLDAEMSEMVVIQPPTLSTTL
jgi:integrase